MLLRLMALASFRIPAFLTLAVLSGLIATAPASAQDGTPKAFLQGIYKHYIGTDAPGVDFSSSLDKAKRYFEPSLAEVIMKQDPDSEYEGGGLDFDPFANGQDNEIKSVNITVPSETADRAKAVASFRNAGRPQTVSYDLVKTPQGWRIHNISWRGATETLTTILAKRL